MMQYFKYLLFVVLLFSVLPVDVLAISNFHLFNSKNEANITLRFSVKPIYTVFLLHQPDRLVLDLSQGTWFPKLPLSFNKSNIIHRISCKSERHNKRIRLVLDLASSVSIRVFIRNSGFYYNLVLSITTCRRNGCQLICRFPLVMHSKIYSHKVHLLNNSLSYTRTSSSGNRKKRIRLKRNSYKVMVVIDAGHGGQDPGAIGRSGLQEKNVTIAIAYKLQKLLNSDPMFKGVMTRHGDHFISVLGRSDVACKKKAHLLISIHADSVPDHSVSGASVWVLSNQRVKVEMANRLEQHNHRSKMSVGTKSLLVSSQSDPSVTQALLDLQFGHVQRVGYDVATHIIKQLQSLGSLHKNQPVFASFGVLRSPDVPSLLIETGFISNPVEEKLLRSSVYQNKITRSIYQGLRNYFVFHLSKDMNPDDYLS
ncbi:N-acetylmuramoyl-L-alanine amidase AmiB [Candidatus Erwinia haradaeae]|uniref:N-acetylmuramoyl-L-alanine amidase n=1 Tax=Candidatus Erwinia haradaeae TaxID=1922217 RepID=A0A451D8E8_9GAMM|nr:N-acetylmuramoyl-L-alanine amidase AmiB [Candidatus Erwinia haradaeae]